MQTADIQRGKYKHYKTGNLYELIGVATHSETLEEMVIYKRLYPSDDLNDHRVWVRPKEMFFESVVYDGDSVPRFQWINE